MQEQQLVFIISQPRAGSTLLQRILNNNSEVYSHGESWLLLPLVYGLKKEFDVEYEQQHALQAIKEHIENSGVNSNIIDSQIKEYILNIYDNILNKTNKSIIIDKTPRYYLIIEHLLKIFPKAKFIFLVRNPVAVFSSVLSTWPSEVKTHTIDLIKGVELMASAISQNKEGIEIIKYEELIDSPKDIISRICDFININFTELMLELKEYKMLDYGDPTGIKYKEVKRENDEGYLTKARNSHLHWSFLYEYANLLKKSTFENIGYNKNNIINNLINIAPKKGHYCPIEAILDPDFYLGNNSKLKRFIAFNYKYIYPSLSIRTRIYIMFKSLLSNNPQHLSTIAYSIYKKLIKNY